MPTGTAPQIEHRHLSGIEIRENQGKPTTLRGYAAVFGKRSEEMWGFVEIIAKGAFTNCLAAGKDVRAFAYHDSSKVLGRRSANTLRLGEDEKGLWVEIDLPDTQEGRDVATLVKRGDLSGMSFGFRTISDSWIYGKGGDLDVRTLIEVEISEVSVVAFPAYPDTEVSVRDFYDAIRKNGRPPEGTPNLDRLNLSIRFAESR